MATWPLTVEAEAAALPDLERIVTTSRAEVVVVDQSSWVNVPDTDGPFDAAAEQARRWKVLARALDIVVVVLVQINRDGSRTVKEGGDLHLHHMKDSSRWESDADGALIIQRLDLRPDGQGRQMTVDLLKHRHGRRDLRVVLAADLETGRIEHDPANSVPLDLAAPQAETKADRPWTAERFVAECFTDRPEKGALILDRATGRGLSEREAKCLLDKAEADKLVHRLPRKGNEPTRWLKGGERESTHTPTPP
jgi:hypothetical protein